VRRETAAGRRLTLDAHIQAKRMEARATSVSVGIVLDGELVYARSYGTRDAESGVPVDGIPSSASRP